MAFTSKHFISHLGLVDYINTNAIPTANILKIDTDPTNGGWVIWDYGGPGAVGTVQATHFMRHTELTDFVNANGIPQANILKIDADPSNGGWCLFWY